MTAGLYNFTIEQGSTLRRDFIYKDNAGIPVNLTNYVARMQIRSFKDSSTVLFEATTANGKLVLTGAQGKIALTVSATELDALTFDVGLYDLEIQSPSGVVTRLLEGTISNSRQVTR